MDKRDEQIAREASQRDAALGIRLAKLREGQMSPVLRRWVNSDVQPIASLLRAVAKAYLLGDNLQIATLLDTPTAELSGSERPLKALMEWTLRGSSPGRVATDEGTFADDLALTFMGVCISILTKPTAKSRAGKPQKDGHSLAHVMASCADALRDAVLGQFITSVQGASAMQAIRERQPALWQQKKSLSRICARLTSQVKPQLDEEARGLRTIKMRGTKSILQIVGHTGDLRRIELVAPDAVAWEVLSLCWVPEGSIDNDRSLWLGLVGIMLSAAQKVGGWFDVTENRQSRKGHVRTTKLLTLSDKAWTAINKDAERWLEAGFVQEPMLVPPENGDYLTVKHRKITGQRAPLGMVTQPEGTGAWALGASALADTPWAVNPYALLPETGGDGDAPPGDVLRLAAHRRLAQETFYLPVTMDFRGRIYYRPTWVTPQSGDLGKSLLCFPDRGIHVPAVSNLFDLIMHLAGLYGGPDKLDKAPLSKRVQWWSTFKGDCTGADKPLTLAAHWALLEAGRGDDIPIQLDGTCNGLQHLSALFRDPEGAKHVNLVRSSLEDSPADIYGTVAGASIESMTNAMYHTEPATPEWITRMELARVNIDRSLCKGPVMVLPYGGTREAVRLSVKGKLLERIDPDGTRRDTPWHHATGDDYEAFRDRDLADHPLFNTDAGQLAGLVWDCISPAIPKAMAAMSALQAIGSYVGERGLSWRVGCGPEGARLWVTQAKSKAQQKRVTMKGFHLPSLVRRLTLNAHMNEVDPKAHRTGIVANFIHSQDAAHLAATVAMFRQRGGGCVGSVHDCLMVRPSEAKLMGECLRDAFVELYEEGPLRQPVRLLTGDGESVEFDDWYALAQAAGVEFPEMGSFDIGEVRESAWFFS